MDTAEDGTETAKLRVEYVKYMHGKGKAKLVRRPATKGKILQAGIVWI